MDIPAIRRQNRNITGSHDAMRDALKHGQSFSFVVRWREDRRRAVGRFDERDYTLPERLADVSSANATLR